jgi:thioredoxin-like negative regulator of GroEL
MSASTPHEHDDKSLPALLHGAHEPVLVESYHGGWDRPWRVLDASGWDALARGLGERVCCAALETNANRELALRLGLEIVPELLVFLDGEVVARFRHEVEPAAVVEAVKVALHERRIRCEALGELESVGAARDVLSPVRSVLRSRSGTPVPSLSAARAG